MKRALFVITAIMFVVFSGCSKCNKKVEAAVHSYAASKIATNFDGQLAPTGSHDYTTKINRIDIKSIKKSPSEGGYTYYFVKGIADYASIRNTDHNQTNARLFFAVQLIEDGFGNMQWVVGNGKEYIWFTVFSTPRNHGNEQSKLPQEFQKMADEIIQ